MTHQLNNASSNSLLDTTTPHFASKQDQLDGLNRPQGHMCITEIGAVMDMLRNEKPIYIHWSEIWKQVWLDTSSESVGEEET